MMNQLTATIADQRKQQHADNAGEHFADRLKRAQRASQAAADRRNVLHTLHQKPSPKMHCGTLAWPAAARIASAAFSAIM